jgi:uncharacterized protein YprB with RNaseH-like and TPR domain
MRDLTARLRDIVRRDHGGASAAATRELTYVPDTSDQSMDPSRAATVLGGTRIDADSGAYVVVDRVWEASDWHGRRMIGGYSLPADAPLGLFDTRVGARPGWADRVVFFDLETTGLSGGAGTLPFLAGCGWFEQDGFHVRQFFLSAPAGERAMLEALARMFDDATLLVTFNGRSFDVPLMEMRWAFHRTAAATDDLPHFDMLPSARRLWSRRDVRDTPERSSCTLASLERAVLGFHRVNDVPGFEIPARYFQFLRSGDAAVIDGVLEHNRYDLLSLAAVMSHALWMAGEGPDACREPSEQLGLGVLYERAGQAERAMAAYERAAGPVSDRDVRAQALARLAPMLGRAGRHDDAAAAWLGVLDATHGRSEDMAALERRAAQALAIHHEHRARDLAEARRYAARLQASAAGRGRLDAAHRLDRIDRKLARDVNRPLDL